MNETLRSYLLNAAIIFFAVMVGPYIMNVFGFESTVVRILSIGAIAAGMTLGFEKLGLLPHLRKKQADPDEALDE